jgi:hypothetical protein
MTGAVQTTRVELVVAAAFDGRAARATTPAAVGDAIMAALAIPGPTVIHAPCTASGAHDVRRLATSGGSHA